MRGYNLRCHICRVGYFRGEKSSAGREALLKAAGISARSNDMVRRRMCDWCGVEVVSIERVEAMLSPPNEERLKTLEKADKQESRKVPRPRY